MTNDKKWGGLVFHVQSGFVFQISDALGYPDFEQPSDECGAYNIIYRFNFFVKDARRTSFYQ